jgi:arylsulfatase
VKDGRLAYTYNWLGLERTTVTSARPLPAGAVTARMDFAYDGGGIGKGGRVTLLVNGEKAGEGRIPRTQPLAFSAEDGTDVGMDAVTPVIEDYQPASTRFTGSIRRIVVEVQDMPAREKAEARDGAARTAARKAVAD